MSTASRAIKNSFWLYFKMGINIFISLYSTRIILIALGEADFGIFNVIGGSIAMLGFLNSTMANATQRFMSYAEGKGEEVSKIKIFNISIILHFGIAICTIILLLCLMPILFNSIFSIPIEKIGTAKIVYLSLIFSTILTIINVPYDALLNAHENMLYYALIGILESIIKLGIALLCLVYDGDRLLLYCFLMSILPLVTFTGMRIYCHRHYSECVIALRKYWDNKIVKSIFKFCSWNLLTAITYMFTNQGLSVVLNHFFGAILNAAQGIANQVNGQLSSLANNLMKAVNPIIVKRTANSSSDQISTVTYSSAKLSTLLILLFAVPVSIKCKYILSIWLEIVPDWTVIFCQFQLIQTVIVQIASPLSTVIYGVGNIKYYAIWKSIMNIIPLVISIITFSIGWEPYWLYIPLIIFMGFGGNWVIIYYCNKNCGLSISKFMKEAVLPIVKISVVMVVFGYITDFFLPYENMMSLVFCFFSTSVALIFSTWCFGTSLEEKTTIKLLLKNCLKYTGTHQK